MGIERYGKLANESFDIQPEHLTLSRFADIRAGDTLYDSFESRDIIDKHFEAKLAGEMPLAYIGDKKPRFYQFFSNMEERFPGSVLAFIYRDPLDVALSWENRAADKNAGWPAARGALKAAEEWNHAMDCAKRAVEHGSDVLVVNYEDLLLGRNYLPILLRLGLEDCEESVRASRRLHRGHHLAMDAPSNQKVIKQLSSATLEAVLSIIDPALRDWAAAVETK